MKKTCAFFAFIFILGFPGVTRAYTQVLISELMYDVTGADTGREWIEVYNSGTTSIDFSSWRLAEGETNHKIKEAKGDKILSPETYAVIADNPEKFLADHPDYPGILYESSFSLSNEGEILALKDSTLNALHQVTYDQDVGAAGDGNSLQKIDGIWHVAVPTPGEANSINAPLPAPAPTPALLAEGSIVTMGDLVIGEIITFDLQTDDEARATQWNFGDGKTEKKESDAMAEHIYAFAGTYTVVAEYGVAIARTTVTIADKPTFAETIEVAKADQSEEVQSIATSEVLVQEEEYESINREIPPKTLAAAAVAADAPIYPWLLGLGVLAVLAVIATRIIRRQEPSRVVVVDDGIELID